MIRVLATLILLASTTPLAAQWLALATPNIPRTADGQPDLSAPAPRTADGHPDLAGLWRRRGGITGDVLEFSKVHEWAREFRDAQARTFFDGEPSKLSCLPRGPGAMISDAMRRIVHSPTVIAVLNEDGTYRQIFMDGRALEPSPNPIWAGYSVGRWDGDTLVVESNGFNDKTWLHGQGLPHTERLRITERYRRPDFGHLELEVEYDDSGTFDAPLKAVVAMEIVADDEMLEVVCNESTESGKHWVGELAHAEATAVEVAPETLAKYVGTYRGYWVRTLVTVEVTLADGALSLRRQNQNHRLLPQSDDTFACTCGLGYIFTASDGGMATEVAEVHVSGAWPFKRVP